MVSSFVKVGVWLNHSTHGDVGKISIDQYLIFNSLIHDTVVFCISFGHNFGLNLK